MPKPSRPNLDRKIDIASRIVVPLVVAVLTFLGTVLFEHRSAAHSVNTNGNIGTQQNYFGVQQTQSSTPTAQMQSQPAPVPAPKKKAVPKQAQSQPQSSDSTDISHGSVAIAPYGIANTAPNYGTQSVYNGPPLPNVVVQAIEQLGPGANFDPGPQIFMGGSDQAQLWQQELARKKAISRFPGVVVTLATDANFANAAFRAQCDKNCIFVEARVIDGAISVVNPIQDTPTSTKIFVAAPATMLPGQRIKWEFRSMSPDPVTVTDVRSIRE